MNDLLNLMAASVPTLSGSLQWLAEESVAGYFSERREKCAQIAREEKLSEFASGDIPKASLMKDRLLATLILFEDAAFRGASDKNLRLIARFIRNSLSQPDTNTGRTIHYQKILSDLSEEEVFLVVQLWKHKRDNASDTHPFFSISIPKLVPSYYESEEELVSACTRLMRTGLVVPTLFWEGTGYGTTNTAEKIIALSEMHSF